MITYGAALVEKNSAFAAEVRRMDRAVDSVGESWQGNASTAASARALADRLAANHVRTAVETIAEQHDTYGRQLAAVKATLMDMVQNSARGMTVADDGAVVPPRMSASGSWAFGAVLLQAELDEQAQHLESRLKECLSRFDALEAQAARAITDTTAQLEALLRDPRGGRLSDKVASITEGVGKLPTDPKELRDFWATLTPAEKDALYRRDINLGNHDGIPQADRDFYNRQTLTTYQTQAASAAATVDRLIEQQPDWANGTRVPQAQSAEYGSYLRWQTQREQAEALAQRRADYDRLADELDKRRPSRLLTLTDDKDRTTIALGDADAADPVVTVITGASYRADRADGREPPALVGEQSATS